MLKTLFFYKCYYHYSEIHLNIFIDFKIQIYYCNFEYIRRGLHSQTPQNSDGGES